MTISKFISRFNFMIKCFFRQLRLYGFSVAFWTFALPFCLRICRRFEYYFAMRKHRAILVYLFKRYGNIAKKYSEKNIEVETTIDPKSNIWVCWWDGEDTMPDLVKVCYKSIKKHAGTHPVELITKYNFENFISIPKYILEKVEAKIITVTHFSNILRANLLYDYGGIWLDATILTLKDISFEGLQFYTLKAPAKISHSITLTRYAELSNTLKSFNAQHSDPQISRWSGFLFAGAKGNIVFDYMREILYAYWKDHNDQIDYLLYDYTIALGYDKIPFMKKIIDDVSCSPSEKFILEKSMNNEFSQEDFNNFLLVPFHKLTWKIKFNKYTKDNKLTIYGYLINTLEK